MTKLSIKNKAWEVYIIRAKSDKYYTGITTDLDRRLDEHKNGKKGARFFHFSDVKDIVYREQQPNRSAATKREIAIKKLSRQQKQELINSQSNLVAILST